MPYEEYLREVEKLPPLARLELCRKKVSNFRQSDALNSVIFFTEKEMKPFHSKTCKVNKVFINIYSMLSFSMLSAEDLAEVFEKSSEDAYRAAFDRLAVAGAPRLYDLDFRGKSNQTTVEYSRGIGAIYQNTIDRINELPSTQELHQQLVKQGKCGPESPVYNATDVRERAICYFASLYIDDKLRIATRTCRDLGELLKRYDDKDFEQAKNNYLLI